MCACDLTWYCVLCSRRAVLTSFAARCLRSRFHLIDWPLATCRLRIFKVWPCPCARGWRDVGRDVGRGHSCLIGSLVRLASLYVTFQDPSLPVTTWITGSDRVQVAKKSNSGQQTRSLLPLVATLWPVLSFSGIAWFPLLFDTAWFSGSAVSSV